eukprot:gene3832-4222_t
MRQALRAVASRATRPATASAFHTEVDSSFDFLLHPQEEHRELRSMLQKFTAKEVEPAAKQSDLDMTFNRDLFRK